MSTAEELPPAGLFDGQDLVVGLVEGGADEVVHAGVGDDEGFVCHSFLTFRTRGEECAGLGDEEAARLEEQVKAEAGGVAAMRAGWRRQRRRLRGRKACPGSRCPGLRLRRRKLGCCGRLSSGAAMRVETRVQGCAEGVDFADLRADVDGDSGGVEPLGLAEALR